MPPSWQQPKRPRPLWLVPALAWSALTACWLLHVLTQHMLTLPGRGLAIVALAASAVAGLRWLRRTWGQDQALALGLLGLLLLSAALRLNGVGHELIEQSYLDEGTYLRHAREIDSGEWRRGSFIYPHLLYNAGAFSIWLADLSAPIMDPLATELGRLQPAVDGKVDESELEFARDRLALRLLVALLSASVVVPVAGVALRLGGPFAALLAALLAIFSPLFNEGSHLVIADYPSAAWATWCLLAVALWAERETAGRVVAAGVLSGLAAGTKYPAGVVAIAVVAVWAHHRLARRRITTQQRESLLGSLRPLLMAGGVSLASFLLVSPTFFADPVHALTSQRGMLFGWRQYSKGGWLGVQPDSTVAFYLRELAQTFGWLVLIAGAAGLLVALTSHEVRLVAVRRRLSVQLAFPLTYLTLICVMSMVVQRNLAPALPALCVLLGHGLFVLLSSVRQRWPGAAVQTVGIAATVLALSQPVWWTAAQSVRLARTSTRELASSWLTGHLPPGSALLRESYGPRLTALATSPLHTIDRSRFLARRPIDQLLGGDWDYLLTTSSASTRFLRDDAELGERHRQMSDTYRRLFEELSVVRRFDPDRWRAGPEIVVFAVPSLGGETIVPDGSMRPSSDATPAQWIYTRPGQWLGRRLDEPLHLALQTACTEQTDEAVGQLRWIDREHPLPFDQIEFTPLAATLDEVHAPGRCGAAVRLKPPAPGSWFVYLYLPEGASVSFSPPPTAPSAAAP